MNRARLAVAAAAGLAVAMLAPAGYAQSVTGSTGGGPKDIQIESDVMEVEQQSNRAVFVGNVDATRGDVRLRCNRLVADYRDVGQGENSRTEIVKLDARGNVIVTSKQQRATGDWAIMDVPTQKVTMGGNVVLTEGKTVIRGSKLELDLNTGKSRLVGGKGGRVRGVFVPSRN